MGNRHFDLKAITTVHGNAPLDRTTHNAMVMREVGNGSYAWGYTDTDDANVSRIKNRPTAIVVPDQGEDEIGTLLIPNSVAVVKDARNLDQAKRLVDYLLSLRMKQTVPAAIAEGAAPAPAAE